MNARTCLAILAVLCSLSLFADDARIESFSVKTSSKPNAELKANVRVPAGFSQDKPQDFRIMVLFGGRNWDSEKTLASYGFDALADKHRLFLLSLSFKDDDYWEPEKWSGKALQDALAELRKKYGLKESRMLYYGYSAGGQCSNLFAAWKPELVEAWGAHACGVWHEPQKLKTPIPAIITCGEDDSERARLSEAFVQNYREAGNSAILKLKLGGHELSKGALKLAEAFFDSVLSAQDKKALFVGDDQLGRYFPADSKDARNIPQELRNEFYSESMAKLWLGGK